MRTALVGFDLAKNVFQVHAVDRAGRTIHNRKLSRSQYATSPSCLHARSAPRLVPARITGHER
jgi:hypothetical protein